MAFIGSGGGNSGNKAPGFGRSVPGTQLPGFTTGSNAATTVIGATGRTRSFTDRTQPQGVRGTARPTGPLVSKIDPDHGPKAGGTTVTITGEGLTGATVTFDGKPVDVTVVDDKSLTFETPAGAEGKTVVVNVTNFQGTTPVLFTFNPAAPTATKYEPKKGKAAGGELVTVTGTNLKGAKVTVGGKDAPVAVTSEDGTVLDFTTPAGTAGDAPIVVTTNGGTVNVGDYTYT